MSLNLADGNDISDVDSDVDSISSADEVPCNVQQPTDTNDEFREDRISSMIQNNISEEDRKIIPGDIDEREEGISELYIAKGTKGFKVPYKNIVCAEPFCLQGSSPSRAAREWTNLKIDHAHLCLVKLYLDKGEECEFESHAFVRFEDDKMRLVPVPNQKLAPCRKKHVGQNTKLSNSFSSLAAENVKINLKSQGFPTFKLNDEQKIEHQKQPNRRKKLDKFELDQKTKDDVFHSLTAEGNIDEEEEEAELLSTLESEMDKEQQPPSSQKRRKGKLKEEPEGSSSGTRQPEEEDHSDKKICIGTPVVSIPFDNSTILTFSDGQINIYRK